MSRRMAVVLALVAAVCSGPGSADDRGGDASGDVPEDTLGDGFREVDPPTDAGDRDTPRDADDSGEVPEEACVEGQALCDGTRMARCGPEGTAVPLETDGRGGWVNAPPDLDSGLPNVLNFAPVVPTQKDRGLAYARYVESLVRRPFVVSFHWYRWFDNPLREEDILAGDNFGLLTKDDEPYLPLVRMAAQANRRVEHWHLEGVP